MQILFIHNRAEITNCYCAFKGDSKYEQCQNSEDKISHMIVSRSHNLYSILKNLPDDNEITEDKWNHSIENWNI
jgi:hypothetical protein